MASKPNFDISELRDRLSYDPETGELTWIKPKSNFIKAGQKAGTISKHTGYMKIAFYNHQAYVHHIAWFIAYGEWPDGMIDHVNGNRSDNRLSNLRLADQTQQNFNTATRCDNTSGVKGVARCPKTGKWRAYLTVKGKQKFLGNHETMQAAVAARYAAEAQHCGEFRRVQSAHVQEPAQ